MTYFCAGFVKFAQRFFKSYFAMECYDDKVKLDIFQARTTQRNDYKPYCGYKKRVYNYDRKRCESPEKKCPPAVISDHESFATWEHGVHIPFDLLLYPKPIIDTNPHKPFQKLEPIGDPMKEESMRTRPRIYMTPAVSLDDVPDPEMRKLLIRRMYTTDWKNAEQEATATFKRPDWGIHKIETSDTVKLKVDPYKPIEERFQRYAKEWDTPQNRAFTDATKEFWLHKDPPVICGACVDPFRNIVPKETKETIAALIADEKLRFPHDYPPPSYAGYRTRLSRGVALSKVDLATVHPFLSTSQAITTRYAEDLKKK